MPGEVLQRLQRQRQGLQCGLEGGGGLRHPNVDTKQIYYQTINMTSWHKFSILVLMTWHDMTWHDTIHSLSEEGRQVSTDWYFLSQNCCCRARARPTSWTQSLSSHTDVSLKSFWEITGWLFPSVTLLVLCTLALLSRSCRDWNRCRLGSPGRSVWRSWTQP